MLMDGANLSQHLFQIGPAPPPPGGQVCLQYDLLNTHQGISGHQGIK